MGRLDPRDSGFGPESRLGTGFTCPMAPQICVQIGSKSGQPKIPLFFFNFCIVLQIKVRFFFRVSNVSKWVTSLKIYRNQAPRKAAQHVFCTRKINMGRFSVGRGECGISHHESLKQTFETGGVFVFASSKTKFWTWTSKWSIICARLLKSTHLCGSSGSSFGPQRGTGWF